MMPAPVEAYLSSLEKRLGDVPSDERDARLLEVRTHLEEAYARRRAEETGRSDDEVALAVLAEFGDVDDVVGTPPAPAAPWWRPLLTRRNVLIVVAVVVGLGIASAVTDLMADRTSSIVYDRQASFDGQSGTVADTFVVADSFVRFDVYLSVNRTAGCGGIRLTAPDGTVALDESANCAAIEYTRSFQQKGTWKIETTTRDFRGTITVLAVGAR